jgi:hypothetical protein
MANTLNLGNGNWATKEDSLLAYNSENGNFKPLPFDFTRASSATVVNKAGLIETVGNGEPRIDFSGDAKGALLLEPTRTNSLPYSADFSTWSFTGGASVVGNKLGIGGSNDAFEFLSNGTANTRLYYSLSNTGELSFSVFAKKNTLDYITLYGNGGSNPRVWFNLANGTLGNQEGSGTGSIESYGNGWYRCTMNWTSASLVNVRIYNSNENDVFGGTTGSVYIQYAQLEQGSHATSYIPNFGNSAGATRVADVCNNGGNEQVINSTEGVLYAEISTLTELGTYRQINISKDSSNRIYVSKRADNGKLEFRMENPLGTLNFSFTQNTTSEFVKVAFRYGVNNFAVFINGVNKNVTPTGNVFSAGTLTNLEFNSPLNQPLYGNVKDVRVYNTALTDAELQALTK